MAWCSEQRAFPHTLARASSFGRRVCQACMQVLHGGPDSRPKCLQRFCLKRRSSQPRTGPSKRMEWLSAWLRCCVAREESRRRVHVVFMGPASSGASSLLQRAPSGKEGPGGVESHFAMRDVDVTAWDVGHVSSCEVKQSCFAKAEAVAFVVDSTADLREAQSMLRELLAEEELRSCRLLVLANKQDESGAKSLEEIDRRLELQKIRGRRWILHAASAAQGFGVEESLEWLREELKDAPPETPTPTKRARLTRRGGG